MILTGLLFSIFLLQSVNEVVAKKHPNAKIFIVAGEANVEGFASVPHLHQLASTDTTRLYESVWKNNSWTIRGDVFVSYDHYRKDGWLHGPLTVGKYGNNVNRFGPEVPIGHVLGDLYDDPVVIIKAGWRGRSLAVDFASPSFNDTTAGFQWHRMMTLIDQTANNLDKVLGPAYKYTRPEIGGFIWWHGYSDYANFKTAAKYSDNLAAFITDVRDHLKQPYLPVVVAELGGQGPGTDDGKEIKFRQYQRDGVNKLFHGTTKFVETAKLVKSTGNPDPTEDDNFKLYQENAETMMEIGQALALEIASMDWSKLGTPTWMDNEEDLISSRFETWTEIFAVIKLVFILFVGILVFAVVLKLSGSSQTVCNNRLVNTFRNRVEPKGDASGDTDCELDESPAQLH